MAEAEASGALAARGSSPTEEPPEAVLERCASLSLVDDDEEEEGDFEFCGSLRVLYARVAVLPPLATPAASKTVTVRPPAEDGDGDALTAEDVRRAVADELGYAREQIRVAFEGKLLTGGERLRALGLRTESSISCMVGGFAAESAVP